ncbi:acyl-CoA synthetase (NDP forming) [Sphingomonas sp. KC8]|nr:acyl-CoA synthetase (NDP forming) [Sphingomonas sp. KC8]
MPILIRIPRKPAKGQIIVAADLARMLRARRVAVIGASERNPFAASVIRNLDHFGFRGDVQLVNPRGEPVAGRATLRRAGALEGPIDAAFVCVPSDQVIPTVEEAADAGVTGFVVVSSGFAETGADGARAQEQLRALAGRTGVTLLGPNALGFANYVDGVALCALERENRRGSFGIASVSGSVGGYLAKVAHLRGVGLSHMVLAGNEAGTTISDVVDFLVDDPDTRSIGVFLESIYDPHLFASAAERAMRAHKPIVMLKAGASENTARLAMAHTGALVGDDRVFDAVARELGICRVTSYEDMIATAMLLEKTGPRASAGVAMLTISGGSGEIASDLAEPAGVSFPPFSDAIRPELDAIVSGFGQTHNPLDVTGAALRDTGLWERLLKTIAKDEAIGLPLCIWDVPTGAEAAWMAETLASIARGYAGYACVPPVISTVSETVSDYGIQALAEAGIPGAICGLHPAMAALAAHARWSERVLDMRPVQLFAASDAMPASLPRGERALLDWLAVRGVPVTPGVIAGNADAAMFAADAIGYPVALKLAAADVAHKSEIGGVRLGLGDGAAVRAGFDAILNAVPNGVAVDGVVVSPMRDHQIELIVSISRDPVWGLMLALGLGGIWVELLGDSVLLPLPVDGARVVAALHRLKAAPLFAGARGRPPVDLDAVATAVVAIANAALALGPGLTALEINPLAIFADRAEAMDALLV